MKASFKNFTVNSNYKGDKKASWSGSQENWNNHLVTVTNTDTKIRVTFEFWGSIINPELTSEYDVLNAFYCFVSDAICGKESFEDFCSNMGYDEDSRTAEKIHKACIKSYNKLTKIYDGDIYDLANELSEQYA